MRAAVRAGVPDYQRQEVRDRVRRQVRDQVRAGLPHRVRQQGRFHHHTLKIISGKARLKIRKF